MDYHNVVKKQRKFFLSGATLPIPFRINQLKELKALIQRHERIISQAMHQDLRKPMAESVMMEFSILYHELNLIIKHLPEWARSEKVPNPFPSHFPGKSFIHYEPYGIVLIISPWNYPCLLTLSPLIGAICAGNCAVLKPSEISTHTQKVLLEIINTHFPADYITAMSGGVQEVNQLLAEKFDYLFFTGSAHVAKLVMARAAEHLTPISLELGGKSPCIVDETVNLEYAARRIIWGKMSNAGQTCLAPDYLYVKHSCKDALISHLKKYLLNFYGTNPLLSASYARIINLKHFERLKALLNSGNILVGGTTDEKDLYIAPTLIDQVDWHDPIMKEEIFGPILPILSFDNLDSLIEVLQSKPKPLSLYLFSKNKRTQQAIVNRLSFGGGCINDCLMQVANPYLPFGGVGTSGLGNYHAKFSFQTFSHAKALYQRRPTFDLRLEYPPYTHHKLSWVRRFLNI